MRNFEKYWPEIEEKVLNKHRASGQYCGIYKEIMGRTGCSAISCRTCAEEVGAWLLAEADNEPAPDDVKNTVFAHYIDFFCSALKSEVNHMRTDWRLLDKIKADPDPRISQLADALPMNEILKTRIDASDCYCPIFGL